MTPSSAIPQIVAETDRWWVVNKPSGWLTIPGRSGPSVPIIQEWLGQQVGFTGGNKPWVVHRIDKETSGLLIFAKSAEAHAWACSAFENRKVAKRYDALVWEKPPVLKSLSMPLIRVDLPIEGKSSVTQVEVKKRYSGGAGAWVRARIFTGRRHQIRIHLSSLGYPILGDLQYGGHREVLELGVRVERVALHASELELPGGEKYFAPLPEDFRYWMDALEKGTR